MNKMRVARLLMSIALLTNALFGSAQAIRCETICGRVISSGSQTNTVSLSLMCGNEVIYSLTTAGNNVSFDFEEVTSGSYTLRAEKAFHVTKEYQITIDGSAVEQDILLLMQGDVTQDGNVNIGDVAKIYSHVRGTNKLADGDILLCADINVDNRVNIGDVAQTYGMVRGSIVAQSHTVTFMDHDGTVLKTQIVAAGASVTPPPSPERSGYVFAGWDGNYSKVNTDLSIAATYTKLSVPSCTVTFLNFDGSVLATKTLEPNSSYGTLPIPTRDGYIFNGWYTSLNDGNEVKASTVVNITEDHCLYARWTAEKKPECDLAISLDLHSVNGDTNLIYGGVAVFPDKQTTITYRATVNCQSWTPSNSEIIIEEISLYYNPQFTLSYGTVADQTSNQPLETVSAGSVTIDGVSYSHLIIKNIHNAGDGSATSLDLCFTAPSGYMDVFSRAYCEIQKGDPNWDDPDSIYGNALSSGTITPYAEDDADAFLNNNDYTVWPLGFVYEVDGNNVKITKYIGTDDIDRLHIPSKINSAYVTEIGEYAFTDCPSSFDTVFIPSSVQKINPYAFYNVPAMKKVVISEGVSWIGECAFYDCATLEYINLPSTVSTICPLTVTASGYKFYGSFLSSWMYVYAEAPNPSINEISVVKDSIAHNYLRNIPYNEANNGTRFTELISCGEKVYTVHYNHSYNGGDLNLSETRFAYSGDAIDLSLVSSKQGKTFIGWNTDPNAKTSLQVLNMNEDDITLYAIFK